MEGTRGIRLRVVQRGDEVGDLQWEVTIITSGRLVRYGRTLKGVSKGLSPLQEKRTVGPFQTNRKVKSILVSEENGNVDGWCGDLIKLERRER